MKIVYIENTADKLWKMRGDLFSRLKQNGHQIVVCGPEIENQKILEYDENGIQYMHLDVESLNINPFKEMKGLISVKKQLQNIKPDLVMVCGLKFVPSCILAAKWARVPHLISYINGAGNLFIKNTLPIKVVRLIAFPMLKRSFSYSNKVFFQNEDDINELHEAKLLSKKKAVLVNGSGVNMKQYQPSPYPINITFSFIGRICREKGILEFMNGVEIIKRKYPTVNFTIIGKVYGENDEIISTKLRYLVENNIVEYQECVENINIILDKTSVIVMPSYREGLSRVVVEAFSKKRSAIVTDVPGNRNVLKNDESGFIIPKGNSQLLANSMEKYILNEDLVSEMGAKCYDLCKKKYDINIVNKILIKNIEEVLQNG